MSFTTTYARLAWDTTALLALFSTSFAKGILSIAPGLSTEIPAACLAIKKNSRSKDAI
jgi:hypothetical protein